MRTVPGRNGTLTRMRYSSMVDRLAGSGAEKWQIHFRAVTKRAAGEEVLMLTIGEPDLSVPEHVIEATIDSLRAGRTGYTGGRGTTNLLSAIADRYSAGRDRKITESQIIVSSGTQNALSIVMLGLVDHGDDVLVGDPYYATYEGVVAATGARVVPVQLDPDAGFHLDPDVLRQAVTADSRALLLNSPHNPTGATLSFEEIETIGHICIDNDLWIISDEVYAHHVFDGDVAASPLDVTALAERTVVVSSLSKSHAMPGYRAGWIIAPDQTIDALLPIAESMLFGTQPFLQDAAAVAVGDDMSITRQMREMFQRRAKIMRGAIDGAGAVRCSMPEAGMFVMADVRGTGLTGNEFAARLLEEDGVAVMPGESFGAGGAGHIRIAMTVADDIVTEAATRIATLARTLT